MRPEVIQTVRVSGPHYEDDDVTMAGGFGALFLIGKGSFGVSTCPTTLRQNPWHVLNLVPAVACHGKGGAVRIWHWHQWQTPVAKRSLQVPCWSPEPKEGGAWKLVFGY